MRHLIFAAIVLMATSCFKSQPEPPDDFQYAPGDNLAQLKNKRISEASGLAASINNPGFLWTHNDSGNDPEVFLIDTTINIAMTIRLKGVDNRDWEDIAVGPGPDSSRNYIYIGEIGDNLAQYDNKVIYRFEEPVRTDSVKTLTISDFDRIVFRLDERKDSEALLVDPMTRDLYVISKYQPVTLYRLPFPQSTTGVATASPVGVIPANEIVAGDLSADGKEILLKNYQNVFLWTRRDGEALADVLADKGKILPYKQEAQGEAITFARDGSGYYTISEKIKGEKSFLKFYRKN